ncbi:MAG: zinc-ribbon domain-containing protein [Candidatus Stahlbacteria bacterium]|nr:MAG: zinc-ribbon domain-containing protein [Candidatus Stahlbacteria bacterium]
MSDRRICEYCRSELPPDATYCPHCGAEPVRPAPVTPTPVTPVPVTPPPVTPTTSPQATQQEIVPAPAVGAGLTSQTLSITAFVLALVGLAVIITFIPALIVGIIALKKEPKGKVFAWIAIGISGGIMLIVVILAITTLIQIIAAPKPWY